MDTKKVGLCRCGRPARRTFQSKISHTNADGRGHGFIIHCKHCCHRTWCLFRVMVSVGWSLLKGDTERVRRHGHETDAEIPIPKRDYEY